MPAHQRLGTVGVALDDRLDDQPVLAVRFVGAVVRRQGGRAEQQQGGGEGRHGARQVAVVGRLAERPVVELVQLRQRRRVVQRGGLLLQNGIQTWEVVGRGAARGQLRGAAVATARQGVGRGQR